jgi:hypothetical protein
MKRKTKLSQEQWTPGPWRFDAYKGGTRIVTDGEPPIPIQIFRNSANAQLMAAAPEMYEVLKIVISTFDGTKGPRFQAEAFDDVTVAKIEKVFAKVLGIKKCPWLDSLQE